MRKERQLSASARLLSCSLKTKGKQKGVKTKNFAEFRSIDPSG